MQAFNSSTFSCGTVNFLASGILLTFLSSQSKSDKIKAIDNVGVILSKIHLSFLRQVDGLF